MEAELREIIIGEYLTCENDCSDYEKFSRLNNVLEIKKNAQLPHSNSIYLDLKRMVKYYIASRHSRSYDEYQVDFSFVTDSLEKLSLKEKVSFLKFFFDTLKKEDIDYDDSKLRKELFNTKWKIFCSERSWASFFSACHVTVNFNIWTLLSVILLLIIGQAVMFLPAPSWYVMLFKITNANIVENHFFNHLYNVILWMIGTNGDFKVNPVNFLGFILLLFFKLVFLGIILDVGFEQIKKKIGL